MGSNSYGQLGLGLSTSPSVPTRIVTSSDDVVVVPIDDVQAEELETVTVTISPGSSYSSREPTRSATIWLYDNEQPTVFVDAHTSASNGLATLAESSATAGKFYLSRTGSTAAALTVNYTIGGTATNGVDYVTLPGTATIPAGSPGVDVVVTPIQDTAFEGTETVVLTLAPGAYARGPSATMYLSDDETSTITVGFAAAGSVVTESTGEIGVPVALSAASASPVTVEYSVLATGTNAAGGFTSTTGMPYWVRIARAGSVFTASRSSNGTTWSAFSTTTTMVLADPVWVGLAVCGIDGTPATATFDNVTLSPDPGGVLAGRDIGFVAVGGGMGVAGGVYTVTGAGTAIGGSADSFYFAGKTITGDFTLTARVVSSTGSSASRLAGIMVREDLRRTARNVLVAQVGTTTTNYLRRFNSAITAEGLGVDYRLASGTLTFSPGVTSLNIPVTITDDSLPEATEHVVVVLRNANGAVPGPTTQHVIAITDNDTAPLQPSVGFASSASLVAEGAAPSVLVVLSQPASSFVSLDYSVTGGTATSGADFTLPAGTLTFSPGELVKTVPLNLIDDTLVEPVETVVLSLANPSGATLTSLAVHTVTIADNDLPVVVVEATDANASEGGDTGTWTFSRTGSTAAALTVNFTIGGTAANGSDYTAIGTSITIPAGAASVPLTLTPVADDLNEQAETVLITLVATPAYTLGVASSATITIADTNTPVVTVVATDPDASETGPNAGVFTFTRTGQVASALTVSFAVSGTATAGSDYVSIPSTVTIPAGQSTATVTVTPIDDNVTEGAEYVILSLANGSGGYAIGTPNFASITIADNDTPPTVVVSQPAAKSVQLASGVGLLLEASATDDGAPNPLTYAWSKSSGPGSVTFGSAGSAATTARFSAPGLYVVRISVTDGQFTAFDDVTVQVGGFAPANWIDMDLGAPSTRGSSGESSGVLTVMGSGTGFSSTSDSAHFVMRQVPGASSVVARLTGIATGASSGALAGVMIRETAYRGARRALLAIKPGGALEWHTRGTVNGSDTSTSAGTISLPAWLKIERAGDVLTAYRASDAAGVPGAWTQVGTPLTLSALATNLDAGVAATNATANTLVKATFDGVALTPAPGGAALITEDIGTGNAVGGSSVSGSSFTVSGSGSLGDAGHFRFQQFVGDVIVTARIVSHTASGQAAKGGVMIRDASMDAAPHGMMGIAHYWGGYFTWRNVIGGAAGTNYGGSASNPQWIRLVREGDLITAWKAPNLTGNVPGSWVKQGATQIFSAGAPIHVGLAVDANSATALNTVVLDSFSVMPGNLAPFVDAGPGGAVAGTSVAIDATVTDDGEPNPPGAFATKWSLVSGPGPIVFSNDSAVDTTASFAVAGTYLLRLTATDGEVSTFAEATYVVSAIPAPSITLQPSPVQVNAGGGFTLNVAAGGTGPFTFQWRKDGVPIAGATSAVYQSASADATQAGVYSVAVSNAGGTTISNAVPVGVIPAGTIATQAATSAHVFGSPLHRQHRDLSRHRDSVGVEGRPSGRLELDRRHGRRCQLPACRRCDRGIDVGLVDRPAESGELLLPVSIPADQGGVRTIAAPVTLALAGPNLLLLASPDPLHVTLGLHSADTDRNFRISLLELTRLIELYNCRNGTTRTGCYAVATSATEDGFAADPARSSSAAITLSCYHSADFNHDGKISLVELTRVIELYNYRSGTTRTGQYRSQAGTEDGFMAGP